MAAPGGSGLPRYAKDDIELAGVTIRAGDAVVLNSVIANRDAATFPDPDRFDITRTPNPHLSSDTAPASASALASPASNCALCSPR
jgi:cytochrome P450